MKDTSWVMNSFTEMLRPPLGWKVDHAILTTYSADLVVAATALLALTDCDLEYRRTGSRIELVRAIETLRGRVCILAQAGRLIVPHVPAGILPLFDEFIKPIDMDERESSWHAKLALIRFQSRTAPEEIQWRIWIGSRNLTRAMNWDAGFAMASRLDGGGQSVAGLSSLGAELARRAGMKQLTADKVSHELGALTWDCPPGCDVLEIKLLGLIREGNLPSPEGETSSIHVISPFVDATTIRKIAGWGNIRTVRTLVSTRAELLRLWNTDETILSKFKAVLEQPQPDLPGESVEAEDEAAEPEQLAESEELSLTGLHAKLILVTSRSRRDLWIGSANATQRGWGGRSIEAVARLAVSRGVADALEEFVTGCGLFEPATGIGSDDRDEELLESARKILSFDWKVVQQVVDLEVTIKATTSPPLPDPEMCLEVAILGGTWHLWPQTSTSIAILGISLWERSSLVQMRLSLNGKICSWLQVAPCTPPIDDNRDRAVIARYLDAGTFIMWVRNTLANGVSLTGGGDWDRQRKHDKPGRRNGNTEMDLSSLPTVEEMLGGWAKDPSAFHSANEKVKALLPAFHQNAIDREATKDIELLRQFELSWMSLAGELS